MNDSGASLGETLDEQEKLAAVGRALEDVGFRRGPNISAEEMVMLAEQSQESTISSEDLPPNVGQSFLLVLIISR